MSFIDYFLVMWYHLSMIKLCKNWYDRLKDEFEKPYFSLLLNKLTDEYSNYTIYPKMENIFSALNLVKFEDVKVVIIGQDPYHEPNQAMGMSFSVPSSTKIPPSLVNIFKEIENDLNIKCIQNGDLTRWAKQGVLLLNAVLTVRKGQANSHKNIGWENLTSKIIKLLNDRQEPVIFVLWGRDARALKPLISNSWHYILESAHPSPLSAYNGFFGCKHFSKINEILKQNKKTQIDWQ